MKNNEVLAELLKLKRTDEEGHPILLAEDVVKAARRESHPLHPRFEWDDRKAANEHRLYQARHLIASVYVERTTASGEEIQVQAFAHVREDRGGGYRPVEIIAQVESMRDAFLRDMEDDIRAMRARTQRFQAAIENADEIVAAIDGLEGAVKGAKAQPVR